MGEVIIRASLTDRNLPVISVKMSETESDRDAWCEATVKRKVKSLKRALPESRPPGSCA